MHHFGAQIGRLCSIMMREAAALGASA